MSKHIRHEVVDKNVEAVKFGFYSSEEVKSISVKCITNPNLFDNLRNPVPDGLYDLALGPTDTDLACGTCRQSFAHCPGHFGHIELPLPVYNPLVMPVLLRLLKCTCLCCHHFKMSSRQVELYRQKMEMIARGHVVEALGMSTQPPNERKAKAGDENGKVTVKEEPDEKELKLPDQKSKWRPLEPLNANIAGGTPLTSHAVAAKMSTLSDFLKHMPAVKCENCGAYNPGLRREGYTKIFLIPVGPKNHAKNTSHGIVFPKVGLTEVEADDKDGAGGGTKEETGFADDKLAGSEKAGGGKGRQSSPVLLTPNEVEAHMHLLWQRESRLCQLVWGAPQDSKASGASCFFLRTLCVPPNRFRPVNHLHDNLVEHPQNVFFTRVLQQSANIADLAQERGPDEAEPDSGRLLASWIGLQNAVNSLLDSSLAGAKEADAVGIRQQLERKEGLFRMNMMGKRVNHACRSVISPDPYIEVNEIGIPPYFAQRLTYPEQVTSWNVEALRELVRRGPLQHPGATHVEDENGTLISLSHLTEKKRNALARTLLAHTGTSSDSVLGAIALKQGHHELAERSVRGSAQSVKAVYRQLRDGDVVLVNRQPTLHKPGIMAHRVKILKGEKTLRLHYANCNVYNADFDGDEMNVHFPQDAMGRAEAYAIVNADEQYIVPTSGSPARGLIQDHIVSATLLTMAGTLLTRSQVQQLLYAALVPSSSRDPNAMVSVVYEEELLLPMPALLKPHVLWSGKQVVTSLLHHLSRGERPLTMEAGTKVSSMHWGGSRSEDAVFRVHEGELLTGALDKAQFGKFGLVHAFHELYGSRQAGRLLSSFSRLFTAFLQMHGFTCGVGDLLLKPTAEAERASILDGAAGIGEAVHAAFAGMGPAAGKTKVDIAAVRARVGQQLRTRAESARAQLDARMTSALSKITTAATGSALPNGQLKPFPKNCMSLMTVTGAKGSAVNFNQISVLLGQQELEGKRVPRMASGKTLPCFPSWAPEARAGGFISDRFLTGLRPQEYYFHCMAGRDGLVDTTVKTSRSGYLQRCLVKNLEGLRLHYDYTVRDSDSSIVQFRYGLDALDATKTSYLRNFDFIRQNQVQEEAKLCLKEVEMANIRCPAVEDEAGKRDGKGGAHELMDEFLPGADWGVVSPAFGESVKRYLKEGGKHIPELHKRKNRKKLARLLELKYMRSVAEPGEPVGVLAAQSVGEPSTQMTLNTFHFAGRGEANVTLGIPRLREILMTAARNIATPIMECPLLPGCTREQGEQLACQLQRLTMAELVAKIRVSEQPKLENVNTRTSIIRVEFYPAHRYPASLQLSQEELKSAFCKSFIPAVTLAVKKARLKAESGSKAGDVVSLASATSQSALADPDAGVEEEAGAEEGPEHGKKRRRADGEAIEGDADEEDEGGEDEGADAEKRRNQETDEQTYDEDDDVADMLEGEEGDSDMVPEKGTESGEHPSDDDADMEGGRKKSMKGTQSSSKEQKAKPQSTYGAGELLRSGGNWHEMKLVMPLDDATVHLNQVVEQVLRSCTVRATPGIQRCSLLDGVKDGDPPRLQVEGMNFEGIWQFSDILDLDKLTTNDIAAVLTTYGVEAACFTIAKEVQRVFGMYGIDVDPRHLSLIADFMTYEGGYRACNRIGISSSTSPLLKMSFETAMHFLTDATLQGQSDLMQTPSSRIVMGRVVEVGTAIFDLVQNF